MDSLSTAIQVSKPTHRFFGFIKDFVLLDI